MTAWVLRTLTPSSPRKRGSMLRLADMDRRFGADDVVKNSATMVGDSRQTIRARPWSKHGGPALGNQSAQLS
jgi:hypothetical protein